VICTGDLGFVVSTAMRVFSEPEGEYLLADAELNLADVLRLRLGPTPTSHFSGSPLPETGTNIRSLKKGLVDSVSPAWNDYSKRAGLIPHDQPIGHLVVVLPAFCPQIAPSGPFLPVMPVCKYCAVCILRFELLQGMVVLSASSSAQMTGTPT
jgi:hypothetical protein